MANEGIAKVQHYVPRFLLRHFGTGKKDSIHVFDKLTGAAFTTNVKNVAAESRFYDYRVGGQGFTIEPSLSKLESLAKPIIKSVLEADSLNSLSTEDRGKLSIFLAIQFIRTKSFRERFRELPKQLEESLRRKEGPEADLSAISHLFKVPTDNEITQQTIHHMSRAEEYAVQFGNKLWVLISTDVRHPFLISDNPIGLQNRIDHGLLGNIGLAIHGIEIYFPLSPRRALAMWCPTHEAMLLQAASAQGSHSFFHDVLRAMDSGAPLAYAPEFVRNFNSLQVGYAERFVFSATNDFSLAREMIATHESYKTGPRSFVS